MRKSPWTVGGVVAAALLLGSVAGHSEELQNSAKTWQVSKSAVKTCPSPVQVLAAGSRVFSFCDGPRRSGVWVHDAQTGARVAKLKLGQQDSGGAVLSPDGGRIYLSRSEASGVIIDTDTLAVTKQKWLRKAQSLGISANGRYLYMTDLLNERVRVRDLKRNRSTKWAKDKTIEVFAGKGNKIYGQLTTENGFYVVQANQRTGRILQQRKITARINESNFFAESFGMTLDPKGRYLYVSSSLVLMGEAGTSGNTVQRYSTKNLKPGRKYTVGKAGKKGAGPSALAFPAADWKSRLAVTRPGWGVGLINVKSGEVQRLAYAKDAVGVSASYTTDSQRLFVPSAGYDAATMQNRLLIYRFTGWNNGRG